ncbi:site-specific integrase [Photobacterium sp. ZSDE20]|uniref:Site-specific integrase n=1 Tax=Photobacterium pectinilyticum TaxID=2906793 RepID=A0ABT1N8W2_9GAMM|nr:site-specific integrase [Photobacterium sp. ZSDE20]MCQ1060116.1 site-specific integrase [Photobacterium sp. ZSDE20]MDD1827572.1 site-specific integrase [Photobacterium sp. ZSDE20]
MSYKFYPLIPNADQLEIGVPSINVIIPQVADKIPDALELYEHSLDYLMEVKGNRSNFNAFRTHINLLLNWLWFVREDPIENFRRNEIRAFVDFCNEPPEELISSAPFAHFVYDKLTCQYEVNEKWQPFVNRNEGQPYKRRFETVKSQLSLLSTFFSYLCDVEFVDRNPAATYLKRLTENNMRDVLAADEEVAEKALSDEQVRAVWHTVSEMAKKQPEIHLRSKLLIATLLLIYPRISELASRPGYSPVMSSFRQHTDENWYYFIPRSKNGKSRRVACPRRLIAVLKEYRLFLGFSPLPEKNEKNPLFVRHVSGTRGRDAGILNANLGKEQLRKIVLSVFDRAAESLNDTAAAELRAFNVHALRHTGISKDLASGRSPNLVMADSGHSNLASLSIYSRQNFVDQIGSALEKDF